MTQKEKRNKCISVHLGVLLENGARRWRRNGAEEGESWEKPPGSAG